MARRAEKAGPEVRQDLLRHLGAPLGSVVIARRATPSGDVIVVRMTASGVVEPGRLIPTFRGFPVDYEVVGRGKLGSWRSR